MPQFMNIPGGLAALKGLMYDPDAPITNPRSRHEEMRQAQQRKKAAELYQTPPGLYTPSQEAPEYAPSAAMSPNRGYGNINLPPEPDPEEVFTSEPNPAIDGLVGATTKTAPDWRANLAKAGSYSSEYSPLDPPEAAGTAGNMSDANIPLQLASLRGSRSDELEDQFNRARAAYQVDKSRAEAAYRSGDQSFQMDHSAQLDMLRKGGDLERLNRDISADPYTGVDEQNRVGGIQTANLQAWLGGFKNPQEAAEAARKAEEYKVNAGVREAEVGGQYDVKGEEVKAQGAKDVTNIRADQYQELFNMMNAAAASGNPLDIRSMSIPGVGAMTMGAEQQPPTTLRRDLELFRGNMKSSKGYLGGFSEDTKTRYAQTLASMMESMKVPETVRGDVIEALTDPEFTDLPADQLETDTDDPIHNQAFVKAIIALRGF